MATVTKPIALNESFNTTEVTPRNIADVLAEGLSHITGRTASEVEYDNTDSGLTADNVQDALDEIAESVPTLPTTDIQTAVDEFETYNGGLLSSLKVALSPNQDLHGYSEPWVGGAGKNKADINDLSLVQNDSGNKLLISNLALTAGTYTMSFDVSKTITSTRNRPLYVISGTNTYAPTDYNTQGLGSWTFTLSADSTVTFYWWVADNSLAVDITNFMIESGSTATDYEPYSNICPISGHTQVDVDVSDGQTTQEQVTVNLGGTYYSGILDIVSGVLTVDSAFIASYNGETLPSTWISDRDVYAVGTTPTTGAEVCYKLATPTPIQLSPTMVKALVGENHLSAPLDGQEITESKYRELFTWDEVEAYVNAHSGGGSGMNYSTEEQVVGTWIDGKPIYERTWDFSGSPVMLSYADWVNSGIPASENIKSVVSAELKYGSVYLASVEVGVNVDGYPIGFQNLDNLNTRGVSYCTLRYTKTSD